MEIAADIHHVAQQAGWPVDLSLGPGRSHQRHRGVIGNTSANDD